ncbi:MAG: hypothetical protein AAB443_02740 [Patescibacteria group bacterium]
MNKTTKRALLTLICASLLAACGTVLPTHAPAAQSVTGNAKYSGMEEMQTIEVEVGRAYGIAYQVNQTSYFSFFQILEKEEETLHSLELHSENGFWLFEYEFLWYRVFKIESVSKDKAIISMDVKSYLFDTLWIDRAGNINIYPGTVTVETRWHVTPNGLYLLQGDTMYGPYSSGDEVQISNLPVGEIHTFVVGSGKDANGNNIVVLSPKD